MQSGTHSRDLLSNGPTSDVLDTGRKTGAFDETAPLLPLSTAQHGEPILDPPTPGFLKICVGLPRRSPAASPYRLIAPFLLYCHAVGAVAAPKVNIVLALMCVKRRHGPHSMGIGEDDVCSDPSVHVQMGQFMVYANLISGILCAVSSPRLGAYSDRYGRKPLIAFSAMGMLLGDVISVAAAWYPDTISVYWILLEFAIGGLTGAFITTVSLTQSYAADCSPVEDRAKIFALLHACMYLGMALGPAAGALFVRTVGNGDMLAVFYAAAFCHALFIGYVGLCIPESLPMEDRKTIRTVGLQDWRSKLRRLRDSCNIIRPLSIFRSKAASPSTPSRPSLPILALIEALGFGVQVGLPPLLIMFSERRFFWTNFEANLFLSLTNATRAIILALILPGALYFSATSSSKPRRASFPAADADVARSRRTNIKAARIAILFDLLGHLGLGISNSPVLFTISGIVTAGGAAVSPIIQSSMTTYFESDNIGELFGAVSLLHSLARAFIPALMQLLYSLTVRDNAVTVFWVLSSLFGVVLILSLYLRP